jgi:hypothetical protein
MNLEEHISKYDFPYDHYNLIFTGMEKKGRNLINIRSCDAGIFLAGRVGTLNEFTIMYDEGDNKTIGLLEGSGGAVDEIIIPMLKKSEKKSKADLIIERDEIILVAKIFINLESKNKR